MIGSDLELPSSHSHVKTNQYNEVSQVFCSPFKLYIYIYMFFMGGLRKNPKKNKMDLVMLSGTRNLLTIRIMGS